VTEGTSASFSDDALIVAQSLKTGERKTLIHGGTSPRYVSTGHLVFAQGRRLPAVPFDAERLEVTGAAFPVAEDVWQDPLAMLPTTSRGTDYSSLLAAAKWAWEIVR